MLCELQILIILNSGVGGGNHGGATSHLPDLEDGEESWDMQRKLVPWSTLSKELKLEALASATQKVRKTSTIVR